MDKVLNERFKEIRTFLKLSQSDIGEKLGLSQGTITDIERGRIGVSSKVASKLFTKLNVDKNWFYTGTGTPFENTGKNRIQDKYSAVTMEKLEEGAKRSQQIKDGIIEPETEAEKRMLQFRAEDERLKRKYDELYKQYNKRKRQALKLIESGHKTESHLLEILIQFVRQIDILQDCAINYFDVYNEDETLPSDILMGYSDPPEPKEFVEEFVAKTHELAKYEADIQELSAAIKKFMLAIAPLDKHHLIII